MKIVPCRLVPCSVAGSMLLLVAMSTSGLVEAQEAAKRSTPPVVLSPDRIEAIQQELTFLRMSENADEAVGELISIDIELADAEPRGTTASTERTIQANVLIALAHHRTAAAMEHLRSVFETQTSRRHDAAYAISLAALTAPDSDQDWRYLVRSLPIVEGEQASSVLNALRRFRRRATKAVWIREVILIGLKLAPDQQSAAVQLLQHWTQHTVAADVSTPQQLQQFQEWFRSEFPNDPDPAFPVDPATAKYTLDNLRPLLNQLPSTTDAIAAGEALFTKATCQKCHRRRDIDGQPPDNRLGPDLTSLGWRRQPQEILTAILYPSHRLNDEYPVTTVVLKNGKTISGLMMPAADQSLKVVSSDGTETAFAATDIEETRPSRISNMPSGLLEPLTREQIGQLLAYLTAQVGPYDPHAASERSE